jgi:hypothetical protein
MRPGRCYPFIHRPLTPSGHAKEPSVILRSVNNRQPGQKPVATLVVRRAYTCAPTAMFTAAKAQQFQRDNYRVGGSKILPGGPSSG